MDERNGKETLGKTYAFNMDQGRGSDNSRGREGRGAKMTGLINWLIPWLLVIVVIVFISLVIDKVIDKKIDQVNAKLDDQGLILNKMCEDLTQWFRPKSSTYGKKWKVTVSKKPPKGTIENFEEMEGMEQKDIKNNENNN